MTNCFDGKPNILITHLSAIKITEGSPVIVIFLE